MHTLIKEWRKFDANKFPLLLDGDIPIAKNSQIKAHSCTFHNFDEYINDPKFRTEESLFHFGLLPIPFSGNLENASVYILLLNPGFSPVDYYSESNIKEFRDSRLSTLHQRNQNSDYPFHALNPKFSWHSGANYWNKRFHDLILRIADFKEVGYQDAAKYLSNNIASLELVPYHSGKFPKISRKMINQFKSVQLIKDYVHDVLVPKAHSGDCLIIVTRGNKYWNLKKKKGNIVIYADSECRRANLNLQSRGGKAILNYFKDKNFQ